MLKTIKGLVKPKTFCGIGMLMALYAVAVILLPKTWVAELVNGILIAVAITIIAAYGPTALDGIRNPSRSTRTQYLAIGIVAVWFTVLLLRLWSTVYLNVGRPVWMEQHWFPYATLYMCALAGIFTLRAPATLPWQQTRRSWRYIVVAVIAGIGIAAVSLAVH